jgi:glycosyltransferase involved in cell wall biosynthesis
MAAARTPPVSVGMPVYNGARHFAEAIESLLAQTCGDFELIVSDNASTDGTWDLIDAYARRDERVLAVRQQRNIGAPANWNHVARLARGQYFKWASASDVCAPEFLSRCLAAMSDDVVLAFGRTCFIDEDGARLQVFEGDFPVEEERPSERFRKVCHQLSINNAQSGLIRTSALRRTGYDRMYRGGDMALMAELAMLGRWSLIDEVLLLRRAGKHHFTAMRSARDIVELFNPGASAPGRFLNLRRHLDFVFSALASPVPMSERVRAAGAAVQGLYWDRSGIRADFRQLRGELGRE